MSLFLPVNLVCPGCGELITMDAVGSVNADRRPDLRDAILNDSFQDVECGSCGKSVRLQPNFNYLDAGRGQWIAAMPSKDISRHKAVDAEMRVLFDQSYGKNAPAAAQAVGTALDVRITFGWPALREKLLARQEGLDDVVLEMLKLDLMRRLPEVTLITGIELRLVAVGADMLSFAWLESDTETAQSSFGASRELYDAIANDPAAWAQVQARLCSNGFVDIQKLYLTENAAA